LGVTTDTRNPETEGPSDREILVGGPEASAAFCSGNILRFEAMVKGKAFHVVFHG
jgi:hypothetical protein